MDSSTGPVIVCGLGRVGWPVLEYCQALGWKVIAIDNVCDPDDPRLKGAELIRGSYRSSAVLEKARLNEARGIILVANDDLLNLASCLEVRRLHPTIRIVVRLFNDNLVAKLSQSIPNVVALSSSRLSGPLLASTALAGDVLARFCSSETNWQIERIEVEDDSLLLKSTAADFKNQFPSVSLLSKQESGQKGFRAREALLVAGPTADLREVRLVTTGGMGLAEWAGIFRRFGRTVWTTFREIEWPVKLAAVCFFTVMLLSSVIFWLSSSGKVSTLPGGLLRALNLMVTSGDLREGEYREWWEQVFVFMLKLSGLLLTAAFTALLTNYLVRARLRGVLSISRVPESGHVVLCGLGTVGMRVVEELRQQSVPVVVLEKVEGGRFVAAARQLGATVLLSDGTVPASLTRAHAAQSLALIAATSSDLANVEIALLAREQNPKLRVVLRMDDAPLAAALRKTTNIRYAMGLPQLIAPAFVLPLFGDRILSLFWVEQSLHLVMEVVASKAAVGVLGKTVDQLEQYLGCSVLAQQQQRVSPITEGQNVILMLPVERVKEALARCYLEQPSASV